MIGTTQTPSLLDAATGELVLRISGTGRGGQTVRLRSRRCTIGSDPTCTLRIRARGVGPVHCTILRETGKAIIRQCGSETRLNGQPFEIALLAPGDRLSVGPLELEVLETGVSSGASSQLRVGLETERRIAERQRELDAREHQCEALRRELADTQSRLSALETELQARQVALEARAAEIAATEMDLDARHAELEVRQSEARAAEIAARQKELDARQSETGKHAEEIGLRRSTLDACEAELQAQAEEVRRLISELQTQKTTFEARRDEAAERQRELDARERQCETFRRELTDTQSRLAALEADLQACQTALEARVAEIAAGQEDLDARQADLDARRVDLDARQAEVRRHEEQVEVQASELAARQAERDAALRQWEADRRAFQDEYERWQEERSAEGRAPQEPQPDAPPPAETEAREPSSAAPVQSIEILRRLGLAIPTDDGPADEPPPPSNRLPPSGSRAEPVTDEKDCGSQGRAQPAGPYGAASLNEGRNSRGHAPASPLSGSAQHEEESIDQYMARLLDRMRSPASSSQEPEAPAQAAEEEQGEGAARAEGPESAPVSTDEPLRELTPRAVAPERPIDLSAMRELANLSANAAIERHARGRLVRASGGKLLVAIVGAICSGVLYWQAVYLGNGPLAVYASTVSLIVALYWSVQYLILTGRIITARSADAPPGTTFAGHGGSLGIGPIPSRRPNVRPIVAGSELPETEPCAR